MLRRVHALKTTRYLEFTRQRADRARIREEWIQSTVSDPIRERIQADGRIRRWIYVEEEGRHLREVLLGDGETVHNAFFDRAFKPSK